MYGCHQAEKKLLPSQEFNLHDEAIIASLQLKVHDEAIITLSSKIETW
jgi:hypothetical protein